MEKNLKIAVVLSAVDKMSRIINQAVDGSVRKLSDFSKKTDAMAQKGFDVGRSAGAIGLALAAPLGIAVKAAAEYERMNIALKTSFQGNEAAAKKAFKVINDFAATTPYELEEVMTGFIKLKNMGLDPSTKALTAYGNVASGMGKSLNDMVEAVADAATGEFERLKEFGIKAKQQGNTVAFTFQGVTTKVKKNAKDIEKYLQMVGNTKFKGGIEAQSKSILGQFSTLKDNANMLAVKLGNTLIPMLNRMFKAVAPIIDKVGAWIDKNPELAQTIMYVVAGAAALSLTVSALGFMFGGVFKIISFFSSGLGVLTKVIGFASKAFGFLASAVRVVTAVMMANPILLIIAAIAAAAYLIITNWDKVKAFFVNLWNKIKQIFSAAWDYIINLPFMKPIKMLIDNWDKIKAYFATAWNVIKNIFSNAWNWIINLPFMKPVKMIIENWDKIKAFFSELWAYVKNKFMEFMDFLLGLPKRMYDAGVNIVKSIWEGIKSMADKPVQAIKDIVGKIRDHLPFSPAKLGPLRDIHRIKLVETIASNVKPGPLVKAMRTTTAAAMVAASPVGAASSMGKAPALNPVRGGGNSSIVYAPKISIQGSADKDAFAAELKKHESKIVKLIEEANRKSSRTKFN